MICQPSLALKADKLDKWAANNIMFYDPDECEDKGTQTCSAKPEGKDITWIGDSYTEGAKSLIKKKMTGIEIHSQSSKVFGQGESSNKGGLKILEELKNSNKLRKYVVMALGTNLDTSDKDSTVKEFEEMLSKGGKDKTYILMKPFTKDLTYTFFNEAVDEFKKNNSNVLVADWESAAKNKVDEFFKSDSIHPTDGDGYQTFVDTFYNALPGGCNAKKLSGNSNLEKIWNYFVDANVEGLSTNEAVIAGILGNLQQESGFNPFATNGSHWGLYQEMNKDMKKQVEDAVGDLWGSTNATTEQNDKAIQIELDYLVKTKDRFVGSSWASEWGFLKTLNQVSKDTPEAYSDLWIITIEGAVTSDTSSNNYIEDDGARSIGTKYFSASAGGGAYYQEAGDRRKYAREIYDTYANSGSGGGSSSKTTSYTAPKTNNLLADKPSSFPSVDQAKLMATNSYTWEDGWLTDGVPGIEKEDVTQAGDLDEHPNTYGTTDGKPNKILLHNTEGESVGYAAYPAGNKYPAHFIVDIHKQKGYQNFPITTTAAATVAADSSSVQIEIVGYVWGSKPDNPYDLSNFSANDWDYLAVLLAAIASETGIPLTTSVEWEGDNKRFTGSDGTYDTAREEFKNNIKGIVGHMHSPGVGASGDDHTDPGNIWPSLEEAIARNPDASKFGGNGSTSTTSCQDEDDPEVETVDGEDLAETAVGMTWPVQSNGNCQTKSGDWVPFETNKEDCYDNPTDTYQDEFDRLGMSGSLQDCGHFIATVVHSLGVDNDFPKGDTDTQGDHLASATDIWEKVDAKSESDLKPGDIMWYNGHIEMYVGSYGGSYGKIASASAGGPAYVGIIRSMRMERKGEDATVYRLIPQTSGGGLISGGMTLEQAQKFMEAYRSLSPRSYPNSEFSKWNIPDTVSCTSDLENCVAFSSWFIHEYTTANLGLPHGGQVVSTLLSSNQGFVDGGTTPKVYAIFSVKSGSTLCGDSPCGHTGVVLGIDTTANKIIIGEAGCSASYDWTNAHEYDLSTYTSGAYTYAYTDNIRKTGKN